MIVLLNSDSSSDFCRLVTLEENEERLQPNRLTTLNIDSTVIERVLHFVNIILMKLFLYLLCLADNGCLVERESQILSALFSGTTIVEELKFDFLTMYKRFINLGWPLEQLNYLLCLSAIDFPAECSTVSPIVLYLITFSARIASSCSPPPLHST
jgi:hypothetical protein